MSDSRDSQHSGSAEVGRSNDKLPQASGQLLDVPRRKDYPAGEDGRVAWKAEFNEHAGGFSHAHVAAGTARGRHGHMGMFGDYLEREGHGKFLQWQCARLCV